MGKTGKQGDIREHLTRAGIFTSADIENFANLSPGMIDVYDYATSRYIYVNNAIRHMLGYSPEELLDSGLDFIVSRIHPDDVQASAVKNAEASKAVERLQPGIDDSKPFVYFDYRVRHKNGRWVWLHTAASVYRRFDDGSLQYVVNTCIDITEQKDAERQQRILAEELAASQTMLRAEHEKLIANNLAKDEFIAIASHQLRNPATGVKQYAGLLLQGYAGKLSESQLTILQAAYDCNERELTIINDLLSTARIDAGKVELYRTDIDLNKHIEQIVIEQQEKYKTRNQTLVLRRNRQPVNIFADEHLIRMVLENLIDNASKYSPENSAVSVSVRQTGKDAVADIKDQGFGIAKKERGELFKKFSRLENDQTQRVSGTGLGLYWAKKIIDLHRGTITLKSSSEKGTTFRITLPLSVKRTGGKVARPDA